MLSAKKPIVLSFAMLHIVSSRVAVKIRDHRGLGLPGRCSTDVNMYINPVFDGCSPKRSAVQLMDPRRDVFLLG